MKHTNVAIFVPHEGCTHKCSFCNQVKISGSCERVTKESVKTAIEKALNSAGYNPKDAEIAFFGGSFTAIERQHRLELLKAALPYVLCSQFSGIRISTRPDYIDDEILQELIEYKVTAIELGAQSMDDEVLRLNERGHTSAHVVEASRLIRSRGFSLGLQMMVGLYGGGDDVETAKKLIDLQPDTMRMYPTLVLKGTSLHGLYQEGKYKPLSLERAVEVCAEILYMVTKNNIKVIKLGLHAGESLESALVAGPYHPAFRELCESKIYLNNALSAISRLKDKKQSIILYVAPNAISKMTGQQKSNLKELSRRGYSCTVRSDDTLSIFEVTAENEAIPKEK